MDNANYSYAHHVPKTAVTYETLLDRITSLAITYKEKPAFIFRFDDDRRDSITFSKLLSEALIFARNLISRGLKKGDYVALLIPNCTEWCIAEFGVIFAGGIAIATGSEDSAKHFMRTQASNTWGIIVDSRGNESSNSSLLNNLLEITNQTKNSRESILCLVDLSDDHNAKEHRSINFNALLGSEKIDELPFPHLDPDDVCFMLSTSGSTGIPKLVPHTHVSILTQADTDCQCFDLDSTDTFISDRPLGYAAGFPYFTISKGITLVTMNTRLSLKNDPGFIFSLIWQENVNCGVLAPYLVYGIEKIPKLPQMKTVLICGQRLSKTVLEKYATFVDNPLAAYGTTESLFTATVNIKKLGEDMLDVLGYANPGYEIKIIDSHGCIVPKGSNGEICVRTISLGQNYITANGQSHPLKDVNGWLHTGDVGFMKADGLIYVKGRATEIIKRATMKIFPAEIERHFLTFPGVEDVVVVGVPDERLYEDICACVMPQTGVQIKMKALIEHCYKMFKPQTVIDGRGLMPKYFLTMPSFPKLKTGKLNRVQIVAFATANLANAHAYDFEGNSVIS